MEIAGLSITKARPMSQRELDREGWENIHHTATALELSNGAVIYASQDDEGNGPGTLFGTDAEGNGFLLA